MPVNTPFFSIITVSKDNLSGLRKTQKSIENQSLKDLEWIIIDGASKDGTKEHLQTTQAHWSSAPDTGIYDAMNKGLQKARGQYVLFLNAGDRLAQSQTLNIFKDAITDEDFIYADAQEEQNTRIYNKPARNHSRAACGMFTHHQAMLYHRQSLKKRKYDTHYRISADYKFTVETLENARKILYIPQPLCIFESGGLSQTKASLGRKEQFNIRRHLKICSPFKNVTVYIYQCCTWAFRCAFPALFWHLKSSGSKNGASVQKQAPQDRPKTPV